MRNCLPDLKNGMCFSATWTLAPVRGLRAMRVPTGAIRVELPTFRDAAGQSRAAIVLPDEVHGPIGDAVIEALIDRGLAKRRVTA